ncbi:glycoside hydrolase family 30 protein [Flavobacterium glycines]|nr:glycoside hydrolase family 30 protein [Flavobacterium glycines]OCB71770.1 glycosyl hydrolase family 30 [Flavobacterium glycines]
MTGKNLFMFLSVLSITFGVNAQKVTWKYTTEKEPWKKGTDLSFKNSGEKADIIIYPDKKVQKMDGFGACFNEMGYEALLSLDEKTRQNIITDFFTKEGMNFNFCRMPLGSNDYSLSYYSYNDVYEDFDMVNFNIDRDRYILIPYIKMAKAKNPNLKIWASPWTPPAWMKVNNHYAMGKYNDAMPIDNKGKFIRNNATAFKMEERYLQAYALYFSKFVQAYAKEGIDVSIVQVQNEPVYQPQWQSCTWRPEDIAYYVGNFLGPQFQKDGLKTEIWLGTVNTSNPNFTRTVLNDEKASQYIKGVGFQWDAKHTVATLHKEYPGYKIMQTESECGNGENNWKSAEYTWSLMQQYIANGASSYMYWNMILDETGKSTWGWKQNMLIAVNKETKEVKYNPEYYLMKHLSHYVLPDAYRLETSGGKDHLAFVNPNGEVVLLLMNQDEQGKAVLLELNDKKVALNLKGKSINTFVFNN